MHRFFFLASRSPDGTARAKFDQAPLSRTTTRAAGSCPMPRIQAARLGSPSTRRLRLAPSFPKRTAPARRWAGAYTFRSIRRLDEHFAQGASTTTSALRGSCSGATRWTMRSSSCRPIPQFPRNFFSRNQFFHRRIPTNYFLPTPSSITAAASAGRVVGQNVEANTTQTLPDFVPGRDDYRRDRHRRSCAVSVRRVRRIFGWSRTSFTPVQ